MYSFIVEPLDAAFAIHFVLFVVAVVPILRSRVYSRGQRWAQIVIALLIPILGPGLVIAVAISDRLKVDKASDRMMGQSVDEHYAKFGGHLK